MKHIGGILLLAILLSGLHSCMDTSLKKPDKLISKDQFVKMMVDMYLMQGLNSGNIKKEDFRKLKPTDLYFSVLKKYGEPDSVFVRSLIYYSSIPKEFEKLNVEIMNSLQEKEQQYKPKDKLQTGHE